jgi:hypothetical protein
MRMIGVTRYNVTADEEAGGIEETGFQKGDPGDTDSRKAWSNSEDHRKRDPGWGVEGGGTCRTVRRRAHADRRGASVCVTRPPEDLQPTRSKHHRDLQRRSSPSKILLDFKYLAWLRVRMRIWYHYISSYSSSHYTIYHSNQSHCRTSD